MTQVRIYLPAKTAAQSGPANARRWILEFEPEAAKRIDPLMGWTGSPDTRQQVRLGFPEMEDAIAYAERNGLVYEVAPPQARRMITKNYADKYAYDKVG